MARVSLSRLIGVSVLVLACAAPAALGQGGVIRHQQVGMTRDGHFRSEGSQYSLMWESSGVVAEDTEIAPDPDDPTRRSLLLNAGVGGRDMRIIYHEPVHESWVQFDMRMTQYEGQTDYDADLTKATSSTTGGQSKRTYFFRALTSVPRQGMRLRTREGGGDQLSLVSAAGGLSESLAGLITGNPIPRDTWVRVWVHVRAADGPAGAGSKVRVYIDTDLDGTIDHEGSADGTYLGNNIEMLYLEGRPENGACRVRFRKFVMTSVRPDLLQNERVTPEGDWATNLGWDTQGDRPDGSSWFIDETPVFGVQTPDPSGESVRVPMVFWYDKGLLGYDPSAEGTRARVRFEYSRDPSFAAGVSVSPWVVVNEDDEGVRWTASDLEPVSVYYARAVINPDGASGGTETTMETAGRLHTVSVEGGEAMGRFRVLAMGCTNASPHKGLYGASFSDLIDDTEAPVIHTYHTDDFNYHDNNILPNIWTVDPEREHRALSMHHLDDYVWKRLARRAGFSVHAGDHPYAGGDGAWGLRNEIGYPLFTNVMDAFVATIDLYRPDEPHRPTLAQMQSEHGFGGGPWGDGLWHDDQRAYSDDDVRFYYTDTRHVRFVYVDDCRWANDDTDTGVGGPNYVVWNEAQLSWLERVVGSENDKPLTVLVFNFMFTYNKSADKWNTRWSHTDSSHHDHFNTPEHPFLLASEKQALIDIFLDNAAVNQRVMALSGDHHATYAVEMSREWNGDGRALLEVCTADAGSGKVKFRYRDEDAALAGTTLAAHGLFDGNVIPDVTPEEYLNGLAGVGTELEMIEFHAAQRETMFAPQHPELQERSLHYDAPMATTGRKTYVELLFDEQDDRVSVESIVHWHEPDLSGGDEVVMRATSMGVRTAAALGAGCSLADRGEPYGQLDFSDVIAFLQAFASNDPSADLGAPFGVWDFTDVVSFLTLVSEGCP